MSHHRQTAIDAFTHAYYDCRTAVFVFATRTPTCKSQSLSSKMRTPSQRPAVPTPGYPYAEFLKFLYSLPKLRNAFGRQLSSSSNRTPNFELDLRGFLNSFAYLRSAVLVIRYSYPSRRTAILAIQHSQSDLQTAVFVLLGTRSVRRNAILDRMHSYS